MNKVGYIIDDKINEQSEKGKKKMGPIVAQYHQIYARFEELMSEECPTVSKRVKLLIKNMFNHRDHGWDKTKQKNEQGPMKLEALRKLELEKQKQVQENSKNEGDSRYNDSEYSGRGDKGGKYGAKSGKG